MLAQGSRSVVFASSVVAVVLLLELWDHQPDSNVVISH